MSAPSGRVRLRSLQTMHGVLLNTSPESPLHWSVIALGLVTVIYIAFIRPLRKGKKKDPLARGPSQTLLAGQRAMERDMTNLLVEYEQMMRKMSAQLETRVAKLELLIHDADERLAELKSIGTTPTVKAASDASENVPVLWLPVEPAEADDRSKPAVDEPPRHADVYALADEGLTFRQIAQRLDRAYGEIELILALRPKEQSGDRPAEAARPAKSAVDRDSLQPEVEMALADAMHADRGSTSAHSSQNSHRRKKRRA